MKKHASKLLLLGALGISMSTFLNAETGFQEVLTKDAPSGFAPLAQAIQAGDFIFISGQTPNDLITGDIIGTTAEEQTKIVLSYIEAILQSKGLGFENLIKVQIFVKNMDDYDAVNDLYASKFPSSVKPAREMIQVSKLPLDALVEISCIAYIPR